MEIYIAALAIKIFKLNASGIISKGCGTTIIRYKRVIRKKGEVLPLEGF